MTNDPITTLGNKRRRSVKLLKEEVKALKTFRKQFETDQECADTIGIDRAVFIRVQLAGSASQETVERIRKALQAD